MTDVEHMAESGANLTGWWLFIILCAVLYWRRTRHTRRRRR